MDLPFRRFQTLILVAGSLLSLLVIVGASLVYQLNKHVSVTLPAQIQALQRTQQITTLALIDLTAQDPISPHDGTVNRTDRALARLSEADILLHSALDGSQPNPVVDLLIEPVDFHGMGQETHDLLHQLTSLLHQTRTLTDQGPPELISSYRLMLREMMTTYLLNVKEQITHIQEAAVSRANMLGEVILTITLAIPAVVFSFVVALIVANRKTSQTKASLDAAHQRLTSQTQALDHLAHYDLLTEKPNRILFNERLDNELSNARQSLTHLALLCVDLDNFKTINDSLGHDVGDSMLRQISDIISEPLRPSDMLARLGGDEFAVILSGFSSEQGASDAAGSIATKVLLQLSRPLPFDGKDIHVGASVGISIGPSGLDNSTEMMRKADLAMHDVKRHGKNGYRYFTPDLSTAAEKQLELQSGLRRAISRAELFTVYQPIIDLRKLETVGCEILCRWEDRDLGLVPPDSFIPVAEETGLIKDVGKFVLNDVVNLLSTCAPCELCDSKYFSINVSAQQLESETFVRDFRQQLDIAHLDPSRFQIEITEHVLLDTNRATLRRLETLSEMGVRIALDDFGTGYSSLSILNAINLDCVKIDKGFVSQIGESTRTESLVAGMLSLCRNFGTQVIAEGIETQGQLEFLTDHGCSAGQGYLFSRPVTRDKICSLLRRENQIRFVTQQSLLQHSQSA